MDARRNVRRVIATATVASLFACGSLAGTAWAATPESATAETPQGSVGRLVEARTAVDRISGRTLRDQVREMDSERLLRLVAARPLPFARENARTQEVASPPSGRYKRLKAVAVVAGVAVAGAVLFKAVKEYRDIPK
jgi:hypothetical protein